MEIKTKKHFNEILKQITFEIVEELDEMTVTGNVDGYSTPFAFRGKDKKGKKKNKKISTNSTGYEVLDEALDKKDLEIIAETKNKIIKDFLLIPIFVANICQ